MPDETVAITDIEKDLLDVFIKYHIFENKDVFATFFVLMQKMLK